MDLLHASGSCVGYDLPVFRVHCGLLDVDSSVVEDDLPFEMDSLEASLEMKGEGFSFKSTIGTHKIP